MIDFKNVVVVVDWQWQWMQRKVLAEEPFLKLNPLPRYHFL